MRVHSRAHRLAMGRLTYWRRNAAVPHQQKQLMHQQQPRRKGISFNEQVRVILIPSRLEIDVESIWFSMQELRDFRLAFFTQQASLLQQQQQQQQQKPKSALRAASNSSNNSSRNSSSSSSSSDSQKALSQQQQQQPRRILTAPRTCRDAMIMEQASPHMAAVTTGGADIFM